MQPHTDQHLIEKTIAGDTRAFGVLVEKYKTFVYTIVLRMVKSMEEAEEIAQDTFIKAFESLGSFRGESKFSSWLYKIAYRKALDHLRKNQRHRSVQLLDDAPVHADLHVEHALDQLEAKERSQRIKQAIMQLSEVEAALVTLYYYEEKSVKEIAEITELTEDNIKVKLFRSRKKLSTLLAPLEQPQNRIVNGSE